jgi:hypothetical protein
MRWRSWTRSCGEHRGRRRAAAVAGGWRRSPCSRPTCSRQDLAGQDAILACNDQLRRAARGAADCACGRSDRRDSRTARRPAGQLAGEICPGCAARVSPRARRPGGKGPGDDDGPGGRRGQGPCRGAGGAAAGDRRGCPLVGCGSRGRYRRTRRRRRPGAAAPAEPRVAQALTRRAASPAMPSRWTGQACRDHGRGSSPECVSTVPSAQRMVRVLW